jgi:membrane protein implicated in regulation of membrane protease activity
MKLNSDATDRRTRRLLVVAQLMTLAFFALGLAFALYPTPGNLFLFTTLSPVLVPGAAVILATQWIAAYHRRQTSHAVAGRVRRAYSGRNPMQVAG